MMQSLLDCSGVAAPCCPFFTSLIELTTEFPVKVKRTARQTRSATGHVALEVFLVGWPESDLDRHFSNAAAVKERSIVSWTSVAEQSRRFKAVCSCENGCSIKKLLLSLLKKVK
jgi:hypothetical protein